MMQSMRQIASAAAAVALLLTAGCGPQHRSENKPGNSATVSELPSPSASSSTSRSNVIRFGEGEHEVFIEKAADVAKLKGTSPAFKAFIADQVANLTPPNGPNECAIGVGVSVYDPAGFARGGVNDCGGYVALWGIQNGKWKELIGTQDLWSCAELRKYSVPSTIVDTCYESRKEVPYTG